MEILLVNGNGQTATITRYINREKQIFYFANFGYYRVRSFKTIEDAKAFLLKIGGYKEKD